MNKTAFSIAICLILAAGAQLFAPYTNAATPAAGSLEGLEDVSSILSTEPCSRISIVLPSNALVGEPVDVLLKAFDAAGKITAVPSIEPIYSSTDNGAMFSVLGSGNSVTFSTPGIQYVVAKNSNGEILAVSNPVQITETESEYKWYWGELHTHTCYSDGFLGGPFGVAPDTAYAYYRDVEGFDFAAVTDHDVCWEGAGQTPVGVVGDWFTDDFMKNVGWPLEMEAVNSFYAPGEFVTLLAQEWTHDYEAYNEYGDGHYNIYYNCVEEANFYSCLDEPTNRIYKMFPILKQWKNDTGKDVITMPHHLLEKGLGWDYHYYDEEFVPLVEIYQTRGSSEMRNELGNPVPFSSPNSDGNIEEPGHSAQDALAMGYKVGFMAGSDDHSIGTGVSQCTLTGIYAKNLTREDIFNSFKDRKCIGVKGTDTRMIVDFTVNGKMVGDGSVVSVDNTNSPREIKCSVAGTAPLVSVTVVKNNRDFYTFQGTSLDDSDLSSYKADFSITDTEQITGMAWIPGEYSNHEGGTGGKDVYYIRVLQKDYNASGGAGWMGPIWVEAQSGEKSSGSEFLGVPGFEFVALIGAMLVASLVGSKKWVMK